MAIGFQDLDLSLQNLSIDQLKIELQSIFKGILEAVNSAEFPFKAGGGGIETDVMIAQSVVGCLAFIIVGITFLPPGATPASIKACQLNTDQKLLKYLGVVIAISTSLSAILYLEVLKLHGLLGDFL